MGCFTGSLFNSLRVSDLCLIWPQHVLSSHRPLANESGETPLDIAKRLRHERCEELVSLPQWGGGCPLGRVCRRVLSRSQCPRGDSSEQVSWGTFREEGTTCHLRDTWNMSQYFLVGLWLALLALALGVSGAEAPGVCGELYCRGLGRSCQLSPLLPCL